MPPQPPIINDFNLSPEQQAAALTRGRDVAVTAGAGTGKTLTLVARYLSLLDDGLPLRGIVAMTFTRKAAREMRNRIRREIGRYLRSDGLDPSEADRWQVIYNELDAARIGTIHTFCAELLRAHPAEARIDPRFDVLDEIQSTIALQDAVEAALAEAVIRPSVMPLLALVGERDLQTYLTRLLKKRLAVGDVTAAIPPDDILAHWQRALNGLRQEAIDRFLVDPELTAARRALREHTPLDHEDRLGSQVLLAREAFNSLHTETTAGQLRNLTALGGIDLRGGSASCWPAGKEEKKEVGAVLRMLRQKWEEHLQLASGNLNDQDAALANAMPALYELLAVAMDSYDRYKAEQAALDFSDLEARVIELLEQHPAVAAYWQAQIRALLVDEFQDTNARQLRLVHLLCPEPGRLFIVGDAKQSIYRFREADVTVFNDEKARIRRNGGELVDLDTSYRAHEQLLTGMNDLLRPLMGDEEAEQPAWVAPFVPLRPGGHEVTTGLTTPFISLQLALGKRKADALPLAARVLAAELAALTRRSTLHYGDIAILCRASGSFAVYEDALDKAGIPYLTVAGKGFYERPEIRDLLNALQAIADPHDDLALAGLLRAPAAGLSDAALYRLVRRRPKGQTLWAALLAGAGEADPEAERFAAAVALIADLNQQTGRTSVANILAQFLDRTQYRAILRLAGQPRALRNVSKLLSDVHNSGLVSTNRFLEYARALRDSGSREGEARATSGGAVQIMSIHAAKGLEFPVVVLGDASRQSTARSDELVDMDLGLLLPAKGADEQRALIYQLAATQNREQEKAESDRMLYVAITRAQQMVIFNGHLKLNSGSIGSGGWLKQMDEHFALSSEWPDGCDPEGAAVHHADVTVASTTMRMSVYEPNHAPLVSGDEPATGPETVEDVTPPFPLLRSIMEDPVEDKERTPDRVWQIIPTASRPHAPAWLVGNLVHMALSLWRFPDGGFAAWCATRARLYGLDDQRQVNDATRRATTLLRRFQQHALYREMDGAELRRHELPVSVLVNGQPDTRYIDALYQHDGRWTIVDFKTDTIKEPAGVTAVMRREGYDQQIQGYGTAVEQLLGHRARLLLCFLDVSGSVALRDVPSAAA